MSLFYSFSEESLFNEILSTNEDRREFVGSSYFSSVHSVSDRVRSVAGSDQVPVILQGLYDQYQSEESAWKRQKTKHMLLHAAFILVSFVFLFVLIPFIGLVALHVTFIVSTAFFLLFTEWHGPLTKPEYSWRYTFLSIGNDPKVADLFASYADPLIYQIFHYRNKGNEVSVYHSRMINRVQTEVLADLSSDDFLLFEQLSSSFSGSVSELLDVVNATYTRV